MLTVFHHKNHSDKNIINNFRNLLKQLKSYWGVLVFALIYIIFASNFLGTGCIFSSVSGIPCMGCGGTRAVFALMHGDILASFHYHPLVIPAVIIFGVYFSSLFIFGKETAKRFEKLLIVFCVISVLLYIIRMIMYFPHTEPMVYNYDSILGRIINFVR
ncbi:MAG: DUF2752 domain-containing protein [Ruminococcus sp.]|jgi:Mn2+/Fe2+ NRAMP family transporter|nr:DUF2752 domain-containing protein [Ruminococcus sp.]